MTCWVVVATINSGTVTPVVLHAALISLVLIAMGAPGKSWVLYLPWSPKIGFCAIGGVFVIVPVTALWIKKHILSKRAQDQEGVNSPSAPAPTPTPDLVQPPPPPPPPPNFAEIADRAAARWARQAKTNARQMGEVTEAAVPQFKVIKKAIVRAGISTKAKRNRIIPVGTIVTVLEFGQSNGHRRGRISETEWLSVTTAKGTVLLTPVESSLTAESCKNLSAASFISVAAILTFVLIAFAVTGQLTHWKYIKAHPYYTMGFWGALLLIVVCNHRKCRAIMDANLACINILRIKIRQQTFDMDIASIESTKKTILVLVGIFVGSAPWKSWGILCCSYIVYLVCKFMKDGTKFKKIDLDSLVELTTILGEASLVIFGFIFINHEENVSFLDVDWTFVHWIYWVIIIPINSVAGTLGFLKACQFCVLELKTLMKRRRGGGGGSTDEIYVVNPLESQTSTAIDMEVEVFDRE
jgi:hypothetical protein